MHDFLWLGFNEDEAGKPVISGIENWIGGSTGIFMNYRFAQPGRTHRQHIARWFPEFQGPFTNEVVLDPITGKTDGRLARCTASNTCPKIFEVNSENEFWSRTWRWASSTRKAGIAPPRPPMYAPTWCRVFPIPAPSVRMGAASASSPAIPWSPMAC